MGTVGPGRAGVPPAPEPSGCGAAGGIAIAIAGLAKRYEIYRKPHHRLLQTLMRGRRRYYDEFWALRDVTMTVRRGETIGVIGRNGSGKSTLLQIVAGTLAPTAGSVETHGRVAALLELGSGFNPEYTGRENVYLNGAILGMTRAEVDAAFPAIAAFAGIGAFIDQPVKTYSSGMTVRLAFSVAVHVTPDILIVDEALAVGDTPFQAKCLERIRRMQAAGVAILLVSHAPNTIIEFCDRAAYLDRGRLAMLGGAREVVERYHEDAAREEAQEALREAGPGAAPPDDAGAARGASEIVAVRIGDAAGAPRAAFAHGEEVAIAMDVAFHAANPSPSFGIQLSNTQGIALWAAQSTQLGQPVAPVAAGERLTFTWRFRASLGSARYVVSLGAGDVAAGAYRRHDRVAYAGHFDVLPEPAHGGGWLDVRARLHDGRG